MNITKQKLHAAIASIIGEENQNALPMGKQLTESAASLFEKGEVNSERALLIREAKKQLDTNGAIAYSTKQVSIDKPLAATALFHDKNNYQTDFKGTRSQVINNFVEDMERRGAIWGRLFNQYNGELVYTYNSETCDNQIKYFITNDHTIHSVFPDGTSSMKNEIRISGDTVAVMTGVGADSYEEDTYTLHLSLTSLALSIEGNQQCLIQ